MNRLLLAAVIACMATSANARGEKVRADCIMSQGSVYLQQITNAKAEARLTASDAMMYGAKRCKGRTLSEGASDHIFHFLREKAVEKFGDTQ